MRVFRFNYRNNKRMESVKLLTKEVDSAKNLFTVINGENGTGKSAILRVISDAALELQESRQSGFYASELSMELEGQVSRTIAISGTPNDRFPINSGIDIRKTLNKFDFSEFYYYGPKYTRNYVSPAKASNTIAHSIITEKNNIELNTKPLIFLFDYLGFSPVINIELKLTKNVNRIRDSNYISSIYERLDHMNNNNTSNTKISNTIFYSINTVTNLIENRNISRQLKNGMRIEIDLISGRILFDDILGEPPLFDYEFGGIGQQWLADMISLGVLTATTYFRHDSSKEQMKLEDLSSGQWQMMNALINLSLNSRNNSLVLIDEPENSLHPQWQSDFISLVRKMLSLREGCHVIVATHSALIASSLLPHDGNLIRLHRSLDNNCILAEHEDSAYGRLPSDVLEDQFNMASARPPELTKAINDALKILKESSRASKELKNVARRIVNLRKSLPSHDPLNEVLDAITNIAFEKMENADFGHDGAE